MPFFRPRHKPPLYFVRNIKSAVGVVLVWRAIWQILDAFDYAVFGGSHWLTVILGFIVGIALLYFPDRHLKALQNM